MGHGPDGCACAGAALKGTQAPDPLRGSADAPPAQPRPFEPGCAAAGLPGTDALQGVWLHNGHWRAFQAAGEQRDLTTGMLGGRTCGARARVACEHANPRVS